MHLTPGDSIMFASGNHMWTEYSRKNLLEVYGLDLDYRLFKNRICLTQLLENLPTVSSIKELYAINI